MVDNLAPPRAPHTHTPLTTDTVVVNTMKSNSIVMSPTDTPAVWCQSKITPEHQRPIDLNQLLLSYSHTRFRNDNLYNLRDFTKTVTNAVDAYCDSIATNGEIGQLSPMRPIAGNTPTRVAAL